MKSSPTKVDAWLAVVLVIAPVICSGSVRSRIEYASIQRVVPTRNMLSNPALSLDRLHVDSGNPLGPGTFRGSASGSAQGTS